LSHFGDLVLALRKERGLTMAVLARKIGSHKGYISWIEKGKVNPPSVKVIKKYAKALGQDVKHLVRLAWVDKAPEIIREDAERFLEWCRAGMPPGTPKP
jgi:transcriptional regulator with XRE-family HTH domain